MYSADELARRFDITDLRGTQRELAELVGMEATLKICERYGRESLYIPANDRLSSIARAMDIHEGFYGKGMSTAELAREFGVSVRTVQRIVNTKLSELSHKQ